MNETIFAQLLVVYFIKTCNSFAYNYYMTPHHRTVIPQILVAVYRFCSIQLCYELQLTNNTETIKTKNTSLSLSLSLDMYKVIMLGIFHINKVL
jgi:hypothetical protein